MMNSKKSFSEANKSSLFVGNLSILCDEEGLRKLFLPFGPVSSVRIKRGDDPQRSHLSYGFVDFVSIESADRAMQLNNVIFLGRALKIGRAEDFATRRSNRKNQLREAIEGSNNHSIPPTAQIHVSFATRQTQRPFCELQLRQVFGQFPNLVDVAIKKNMANPSIGLQSGYAFVHYSMDDAGIRSALAAVECLNGRTADGVKYECSLTHGLKTFLQTSYSYQGRQSPVSIASPDQYYQCAPYSPTSMNKLRDNSFRVIPSEERLPSPLSYHNGWNSGSSMSLSSASSSSSSSSSYVNLLERETFALPSRLAAASGDDMMNYIEQQVLLLVDEN